MVTIRSNASASASPISLAVRVHFRRMDHGEREARRELRQLRLPVRDQRGRHDEQARAFFCLVALQIEQQRDHLDRLAEAHVVGQAGAQPQAGDESQPGVARLLIRAKLRLQVGRGLLLPGLGRTQALEDRIQLRAGGQARPFANRRLALVLVLLGEVRPGQEAHPFKERDALPANVLLDVLPVLQGFLQLLAIDLDPLPLQRDQAAAGFEQLGDLIRAERFSVEAHADGELQHRIDPDARRILRVDLHADAGPGRLLGVPPVGHPHDQPARFEQRDRLEELVRFPRRPREGVIDLPGIDESPNQFRGFGGPRDRQQQV